MIVADLGPASVSPCDRCWLLLSLFVDAFNTNVLILHFIASFDFYSGGHDRMRVRKIQAGSCLLDGTSIATKWGLVLHSPPLLLLKHHNVFTAGD